MLLVGVEGCLETGKTPKFILPRETSFYTQISSHLSRVACVALLTRD